MNIYTSSRLILDNLLGRIYDGLGKLFPAERFINFLFRFECLIYGNYKVETKLGYMWRFHAQPSNYFPTNIKKLSYEC